MKKIVWLLLCMVIAIAVRAQSSKIDSLKKLLQTEKIDTARVKLLMNLSFAFGSISSDSSLHYAFETIKLADKASYYPFQVIGRYTAGYVLGYTGNFVQSMQQLLQGKAIAQKHDDSILVRAYYFYLGHLYKRQNDYPNAIKSYLLSFNVVSRTGQPEMNLGFVYMELGKADSSLYFYNKAFEIQTTIRDDAFRANIIAGIGLAHAKKGDLAIAKGYISTAEDEAKQQQHPQQKQLTCLIISKYFAEIDQVDSGIYYARQALFLKGGEVYKPTLFDAAVLLANLYEGRNSDSAYKFLRMSLSLNKEMLSNEKNQQLQTLRFQDEVEQQKVALERKHNLQYAAIALGIIMFIILFFLFSHSVVANQRFIKFLGILCLLIVFEFLNLLLHPYIGNLTHHSPVMMLGIMVCIAALLIPLHHKLEHWITHKLVEKNKKIRLAAAKKTIEQLERSTDAQQQL